MSINAEDENMEDQSSIFDVKKAQEKNGKIMKVTIG
jgi:hypothetical protein